MQLCIANTAFSTLQTLYQDNMVEFVAVSMCTANCGLAICVRCLLHSQIVSQEGLEVLEDEVVRLLQGIDIDGSNTLDYREFLAATMDRNVFIREENMRCG
jgi:hypothetical protein